MNDIFLIHRIVSKIFKKDDKHDIDVETVFSTKSEDADKFIRNEIVTPNELREIYELGRNEYE